MKDDLINRQAAIDAVMRDVSCIRTHEFNAGATRAANRIKELPAVQPERSSEIQNILEYLDIVLHPIISPDHWNVYSELHDMISMLPSVQPERDIPIKPNEATDTAWGITNKQAVCPKCDYYLGHVAFLGDYKGKKVTYCETCGQAIDWEGWDFE